MAFPNGGHWVTFEDGQHVLINDSNGTIMAGLGPQNNGKTFAEAFGNESNNDNVKMSFSNEGKPSQNPDKNINKIANQLYNDFPSSNATVYQLGEGSLKRENIVLSQINQMLSGGREQTTDTLIRFANSKKSTGTLQQSIKERVGIGGGDSDFNTSGFSRDFSSYEELTNIIKNLNSFGG